MCLLERIEMSRKRQGEQILFIIKAWHAVIDIHADVKENTLLRRLHYMNITSTISSFIQKKTVLKKNVKETGFSFFL